LPAHGVDPERVHHLHEREQAEFVRIRPRSADLWKRAQAVMPNGVPMSWMRFFYDAPPVYISDGRGAHFRDVDGIQYADFNIADMSMFCGYGPEPVVAAVARRVEQGSQFMLASEDALWVAAELGRRYGLPKWQFTLSASQANVEAIRLARAATGRDKVVMFDGKYHGHFDDALVELKDGQRVPEEPGLPRGVAGRTKIVQFNDPEALAEALEPRDVAIVLTEPALTNVVGLLMPDPDFHARLRALTRETGTVLAYDETHTQVTGPGGLTAKWSLEMDVVTMGKSIAGGVPLGAYGMSDALADVFAGPVAAFDGHPPVASGGTLFGNPLSMAASRAALSEVLTDDAYAHTQRLGERLANGIRAMIERAGLPWSELRLGPRSGVCFAPGLPRNALEAYAVRDVELMHTMWTYLANRGVWDALIGAGPTCCVPAQDADVDRYLAAFGDFLAELVR
jgi:glutamate-1-semialdehyde aminotransferase